jgi:hypothetical protein
MSRLFFSLDLQIILIFVFNLLHFDLKVYELLDLFPLLLFDFADGSHLLLEHA